MVSLRKMTVFYYKIRKSVNIQWQPTIHHILITSKCSPNSSHHWPEQPKKIIHTTWTIRSELMTFFPPFFETSFKSYLKYDTETLKKLFDRENYDRYVCIGSIAVTKISLGRLWSNLLQVSQRFVSIFTGFVNCMLKL